MSTIGYNAMGFQETNSNSECVSTCGRFGELDSARTRIMSITSTAFIENEPAVLYSILATTLQGLGLLHAALIEHYDFLSWNGTQRASCLNLIMVADQEWTENSTPTSCLSSLQISPHGPCFGDQLLLDVASTHYECECVMVFSSCMRYHMFAVRVWARLGLWAPDFAQQYMYQVFSFQQSF